MIWNNTGLIDLRIRSRHLKTAGKEIVQKLDMPEKTEQEDRADRSLSHKKETARDASAHMQGDRADLVNMRDENAIGA